MNILFLAANPQGTSVIQLRNEANKIHRSLQKAGVADEYRLIEKWAVNSDALRRALLDEKPDIVHFSGHGTGAEGLMLEGQDGIPRPATGNALADLFKIVNDIKPVRCVLLNACYAEEQAKAIFRHINNVVGMRGEVKDDAAIAFATGFYDGLGRKYPIQTAFDLGCVAIQFETASFSQKTRKAVVVLDKAKESLKPIPDHLIPILFSRETGAAKMQMKPLSEALKESGVSKEEALRQYRENVQSFLADGVLTPTEAFQLSTRATALKLTEAEANRIVEEEQKQLAIQTQPFSLASTAQENLDATFEIVLAAEEMSSGTEKHIATEQGEIVVKIPAGVSAGKRIRVKGKGTLDSLTQKRGDLYLVVKSSNAPSVEDELKSSCGMDYRLLRDCLAKKMWQEADEETENILRLLLDRMRVSELPCTDLWTIDQLWAQYTGKHCGFSIQRRILQSVNGDWKQYCHQVGWLVQPERKVGFLSQFRGNSSKINASNVLDIRSELKGKSLDGLPQGYLPSFMTLAATSDLSLIGQLLNRLQECRL